MSVWIIIAALVGLGTLGLVIVAFRLHADPSCPRCGQRDWSKGVPPWRCRRCGERYQPATRTSEPATQAEQP
jgi:tRNA(Ile2) C34 agmatinyltransferase TiaS